MRTRQITGLFATEEYFPEPRLQGALLRLRPDWMNVSRVQDDAAPYLLDHNKGLVVGKVANAWPQPGVGCRFVADVPVDDEEPIERVIQYLREYDQGLRGLFSPGWLITDIERVGSAPNGRPMFDGAWILTEITDSTVPVDTAARADDHGEKIQGLRDAEAVRSLMGIVDVPEPDGLLAMRGIGKGRISPEVLAATSRFNIKDPLIRALSARRIQA